MQLEIATGGEEEEAVAVAGVQFEIAAEEDEEEAAGVQLEIAAGEEEEEEE